MPPSTSVTHLTTSDSKTRWLGTFPLLSLVLFLSAIATLIWLTRQYDADEQQATLISDALWIEQNLRFQLDRNENLLQQSGFDLLQSPNLSNQNQAQLRQLLNQNTGLVRIVWLDRTGTLIGTIPPAPTEEMHDALDAIPSPASLQLAHVLGRATYEVLSQGETPDAYLKVIVPIWSDSINSGTVVGIYSLSTLLAGEIPWWFSQRYRLAVVDENGQEVAAKSRVGPHTAQRSYTIPFDPPGHGLALRLTPYKNETRWFSILLTASILLLGGMTIWSIWQLRRQLARRHAAEHALKEESAYRKAMEDSLTTGLRARDLDGRITYVNPAFCRMTGYSAEELIGQLPPLPYWEANYIELRTTSFYKKLLEHDSNDTFPEGIEIRFKRKNGDPLDILLFEAPLIDAQGHHTGWMGSMLDITEQKRARELAQQQEERLQATSRLVTMGEMASTLAHELNQPLAAIASYNSGCLNRLEEAQIDRAELYDIHEKIGRQARRAGNIIRQVHDFVRRSPPRHEALNLNDLILNALALIEADARKRSMKLTTDLAHQLPDIHADPVMIEQVIVNLVRNGMDAMRETPRAHRIIQVATRCSKAYITVRVTDHGCGVPPDVAHRLFEPFFTTKQEGMGIGLNICRSIAEHYRGRLSFEANPVGGTILILTLPLHHYGPS